MTRTIAALLVALLPLPTLANDGFGGLSATGLTFDQTDAIAMEAEDLFIGLDRITVDYRFRNLTAQDVTGEVIFPLPPISLQDLVYSDFNLPPDPGRENLVDFVAEVDGVPVQVTVDRIAVIEPEAAWQRPPSARYDAPGQDVTARLRQFGLPVTADVDAVLARLAVMSPPQLKVLAEAGLIDALDGDAVPLWSVVLRYHWTQTFPAGAVVRVHHAYDNRPMGGIFVWEDPPRADYLQDLVKDYCIDAGTSRAIAKRLAMTQEDGSVVMNGIGYNIAYVLRTANSWAGPIGQFRLTLDKGSPRNVISLCAEGVEKTGPTTFVVTAQDFVPGRDLKVLVVRTFD